MAQSLEHLRLVLLLIARHSGVLSARADVLTGDCRSRSRAALASPRVIRSEVEIGRCGHVGEILWSLALGDSMRHDDDVNLHDRPSLYGLLFVMKYVVHLRRDGLGARCFVAFRLFDALTYNRRLYLLCGVLNHLRGGGAFDGLCCFPACENGTFCVDDPRHLVGACRAWSCRVSSSTCDEARSTLFVDETRPLSRKPRPSSLSCLSPSFCGKESRRMT